mgnify:CR=1 FL=1
MKARRETATISYVHACIHGCNAKHLRYQGANAMVNGNANNIGVSCSATSAAGLPWAMPVTQSCMAFLYWTATPQLVAFLSWAEKRASSACLSADATLAGSAFLS